MENVKSQLEILNVPICETELSPLFKKKSEKLGFRNLGDITANSWTELQKLKKFEYSWYIELIRFLDSNNLLSLIDSGAQA